MKKLKQIIAVILSAAAVISTAMVSVSAQGLQGYDLNGDGKFDVVDVTYLQINISGDGQLTDEQKKIADYNNDGKIDVQDVTTAQMLISSGDTPTAPTTQPTTAQPTTKPVSQASYNREFADKVIELINAERTKEGIPALQKDTTITNAADTRAKETVTLFSHQRPNETSWITALIENNVFFSAAAENIAKGQTTPAQVVKAWMESPSHRQNIMNSNYNKIGVSCYVDNNVYYWEQLFVKG